MIVLFLHFHDGCGGGGDDDDDDDDDGDLLLLPTVEMSR